MRKMEKLVVQVKLSEHDQLDGGRSPMRSSDMLEEMTGHSLHKAIEMAQNRKAWKQQIEPSI